MQQTPVLQPTPQRSLPCLPAIKLDRIRTAKALVEEAVKLHKVFSVQGPYPVIRQALRSRGWVEKRLPRLHHKPQSQSPGEDEGEEGETGLDTTDAAEEDEKEESRDDMNDLMSRMVRNEPSFFYWTTRRDSVDCHSLRKDQMINHYENAATFTTKVGLCVNLRNLQWFDSADPDTFFPRCYVLGAEDEKHAFIEDFRRTACTSLLQHVVETQATAPPTDGLQSRNKCGNKKPCSVGSGIIETALRVCQEFLIDLDHGDIDRAVQTPLNAEEQQWNDFLQEFYLIIHHGAEIKGSGLLVERCLQMLTKLREVCPQLDTDGVNNIWIIKPGAKSRGRGIICMNRLDDIMALVDRDRAILRDSRWVVQKYLERPLLVYDTKFDVRQWFLVTDWNPLTVWFYRECYLRFSTQPYSTKNLHSSVHLCNNSIQKHFQPSKDRHPALPEDSMWSCAQFRSFLSGQGREGQWERVVVPGMKQAVVRALQTAQDLVVPRRASFELYGADFMLGRDLRPWLLEINASPTMACSTEVTARLCPAVQRDTLRVVLDRRANPSAYTGGFQLIYKQPAVEVPQYVGVNLLIEGASIRKHRAVQKPPVHSAPVTSSTLAPVTSSTLAPVTSAPVTSSTLTPVTSAPVTSVPTPVHSAPVPGRSCPLQEDITHKPAVEKAHTLASIVTNKENRTEKRRQNMLNKSGHDGRALTKLPSSAAFKSLRALPPELPLVSHTEPHRKTRRLGQCASTVPLVPRSLSFSFNPPAASLSRTHFSTSHRFILPQAPLDTPLRTCPGLSVQKPLPSIEVFSLRTSALARTVPSRNPSFHLGLSSTQRKQLFLLPFEQSVVVNKNHGQKL